MQYLPTTSDLSQPSYISLHKTPTRVYAGLNPRQQIMKRIFDITVASIVFICVLPVFLLVAIVIMLDSSGGIFYFQERYGIGGRKFRMFKFRSMVKNADKMVDEVKVYDEDGNTIYKRPNDMRITRMGKFIRRTSLDELPQLLNVIRGDMSLVGPRPEVTRIVEEEYAPWQYERFNVPQGITGWWQVTSRSEKECYKATNQDIFYVRNYSFWLDIKILLMTVPALLKSKGAF